MIVRIVAAAEQELHSACDYLEKKMAGLGLRFVSDLEAVLDEIASHLLRFAKLETLPAAQPFRRALLLSFPFAVIFEVLPDEVVVLAVAHASRKPNYWLDR